MEETKTSSDTDLSMADEMDSFVTSLPEEFSGTVLVAVGGEVLVNKGYGLANLTFGVPNGPETKFLIGSITKQFTAVLALQLAERGLLDLDATIDTYLPDYPREHGKRITVHHLVSHTSGVSHHLFIPNYFDIHDRLPHSPKEYLRLFWDKDLEHEPGERFTYTSPGYFTLALILEVASGKSYAELLEDQILKPLGMSNTHVHNNLTVHRNLATGYMLGLNGLVLARHEEESNRLGAGSLLTTAEDLYRFQRTLTPEGDTILSRPFKDLLLKPQAGGWCYAGSLGAVPIQGGARLLTTVSTGGSSHGFSALVDRLIEPDVVIVVLSNMQSEGSPLGQIVGRAKDLIVSRLGITLGEGGGTEEIEEPKRSPVVLDRSQLDAYAGFYRFESGTVVGVFPHENGLFRRRAGRQVGPLGFGLERRDLIPRGNGVFEMAGAPDVAYRFVEDASPVGPRIEVLREGSVGASASQVEVPAEANIDEYAGAYCSVELQRVFHLTPGKEGLTTKQFLGVESPVFVPLGGDLFGYEGGFLVFQRDAQGEVRGFKLETEHVDTIVGSTFLRHYRKRATAIR
jgi:CubicO group peptidase (beta-lactamase class C family)